MNSSAEKHRTPQEAKRERDRDEIIALLRRRAPFCFLCKWIVENFDLNGTIRGHPKDALGAEVFPYSGKIEHIRLEQQSAAVSAATVGAI